MSLSISHTSRATSEHINPSTAREQPADAAFRLQPMRCSGPPLVPCHMPHSCDDSSRNPNDMMLIFCLILHLRCSACHACRRSGIPHIALLSTALCSVLGLTFPPVEAHPVKVAPGVEPAGSHLQTLGSADSVLMQCQLCATTAGTQPGLVPNCAFFPGHVLPA
jgi:hypothetical protein